MGSGLDITDVDMDVVVIVDNQDHWTKIRNCIYDKVSALRFWMYLVVDGRVSFLLFPFRFSEARVKKQQHQQRQQNSDINSPNSAEHFENQPLKSIKSFP